jgi:hypothetical protein
MSCAQCIPSCAGLAPPREVSSEPLPNPAQFSKDGASPAQQVVQRGRSGLTRLSAGLSRLGAGILSGLQPSQNSALHRGNAPGAHVATRSPNGKSQSAHRGASNRGISRSHGSLPAPPPSYEVGHAARSDALGGQQAGEHAVRMPASKSAPGAVHAVHATSTGDVGSKEAVNGGQAHDRSGMDSAVARGSGGLASENSLGDVSPGFWPPRLHEAIKVCACFHAWFES